MTTRRRAAAMGSAPAPPPDRAAGLAAFDLGERPPAHPTAQPPVLTAPAPPTSAGSAPPTPLPPGSEPPPAGPDRSTSPPRAASGPRKQGRPRAATTPTKLSPRIPARLFQQVNDARQRTGETHEAWFLRIAETVADQIPQLYPRRSSGSTFPQRAARRRRAPGTEPLVQYPLRLTADEQAPLHAWLRDLPVPSMSELITSIVRLGITDTTAADG